MAIIYKYSRYLSKITFSKKKGKKRRQVHVLFHNQNRVILPLKKAVAYTFYKKNMKLRSGAKWNLRKDYEYNT